MGNAREEKLKIPVRDWFFNLFSGGPLVLARQGGADVKTARPRRKA